MSKKAKIFWIRSEGEWFIAEEDLIGGKPTNPRSFWVIGAECGIDFNPEWEFGPEIKRPEPSEEFDPESRGMKAIEYAVASFQLPAGFHLHSVDGQTLFPIYSASGGITTTSGVGLIKGDLSDKDGLDFGRGEIIKGAHGAAMFVEFDGYFTAARTVAKIHEGIESLNNA